MYAILMYYQFEVFEIYHIFKGYILALLAQSWRSAFYSLRVISVYFLTK